MTPANDSLEALVDRLFESLQFPETRTLVVHRWPDIDAWLCVWMAKKFMFNVQRAEVLFVNAGETINGVGDDSSVVHFDTGGGDFDQHGKNLQRISSAMLLAEKLGIQNNPGLKALLELTVRVDNVEELPATSLQYLVEGWPRMLRAAKGTPDWQQVQQRVFEAFNIIYGQESQRKQSRENLSRFGGFANLANGLKVIELIDHPEIREAAFEKGAAAVVWTQRFPDGNFYVGVQTSRKHPTIRLERVAASLREAEARARGINVKGVDLSYIGRREPVSNWFLHDSRRLILCGSRTWELQKHEFTKLTPIQICTIVKETLSHIKKRDGEAS